MSSNHEERLTYDAIVIGSGIGGLSTASLLGSLKKKVLILEKNHEIGGCMKPLSQANEKGENVWEWNLGMQYVLKYGPLAIYNILLQIVTGNRVKFGEMSKEFQFADFYKPNPTGEPIKDFSYTIYADTKMMRNRLLQDFPDEKKAINQYYRYLNNINFKVLVLPLAKFFPIWLAKILYPVILFLFFPILFFRLYPITKTSIVDVVNKKLKIKNEQLKTIIYSYWHFTGMEIEDTPFLFYAVAVKMCEGGVFYPCGGTKAIIKAFTDYFDNDLKKGKVDIRCNSNVASVIIEKNKAVGVELDNGLRIFAKKIVSNIGVIETINKLVSDENRNKMVKVIGQIAETKIGSSSSGLFLRVAIEGDLSEYNIGKSTYRYAIGNTSLMHGDPTKKDWLPPDLTYSFTSKFDTSRSNNVYHSVDIIQLIKYSYFEHLTYNSPEYEAVAERITDTILGKFDEWFPGIRKKVKYTTLTTPLSVIKDTSHTEGALYALNMTKAGYPEIQPRTGIKNFYFTGEALFSQGITAFDGVLMTAVAAGFFRTVFFMVGRFFRIRKSL